MNHHYFTDNRHLPENRKEISFRFWCFSLAFMTDLGVFSKSGVDFGTRVLLNTVEKQADTLGNELLDMGCGYGVIGICLKKTFPDKSMTMVDINPRAVELAALNAQKNDVQAQILVSDGFEELHDHTYSDILTNPPIRAGKKVIYAMFAGAYEHLRPGGSLWVVIRKAQGAPSAHNYITSVFGNCEVIGKENGYFVLKAQKALTI